MPLSKLNKQKIVEKLSEKINKQKSMVFFDFTGMKVKDFSVLRKKIKSVMGEVKVVKKTLLKIALAKAGIKEIDVKKIQGEIAVALSFQDEIVVPKICYEFSKLNPTLKILGGLFQNRFLESKEVIALAQLPSREELLSKLVWSVAWPIRGIINVFQANIKGLIYALSVIKK